MSCAKCEHLKDEEDKGLGYDGFVYRYCEITKHRIDEPYSTTCLNNDTSRNKI